MFREIYTQAAGAEAFRLDQVAGVGYRKSLEFLIKDYCISNDKAAEDAIKREFLGETIKNRVDDRNVKSCAERAAWLGNDETHYVRKWEDKDISDLKTLIRLTVNWISNEVLTDQYLKDMDKPKK